LPELGLDFAINFGGLHLGRFYNDHNYNDNKDYVHKNGTQNATKTINISTLT